MCAFGHLLDHHQKQNTTGPLRNILRVGQAGAPRNVSDWCVSSRSCSVLTWGAMNMDATCELPSGFDHVSGGNLVHEGHVMSGRCIARIAATSCSTKARRRAILAVVQAGHAGEECMRVFASPLVLRIHSGGFVVQGCVSIVLFLIVWAHLPESPEWYKAHCPATPLINSSKPRRRSPLASPPSLRASA